MRSSTCTHSNPLSGIHERREKRGPDGSIQVGGLAVVQLNPELKTLAVKLKDCSRTTLRPSREPNHGAERLNFNVTSELTMRMLLVEIH